MGAFDKLFGKWKEKKRSVNMIQKFSKNGWGLNKEKCDFDE